MRVRPPRNRARRWAGALLALTLLTALAGCRPPGGPDLPDLGDQPARAPAVRLETATEDQRGRLYAVGADGRRTLVADEPYERLILPQFAALARLSPDGGTVAYVIADDESLANAELWLVGSDGGDPRLLATFPDELWVMPPAWAPDGSALALTVVDRNGTAGDLLLAVVQAEDGEQRRLRVPGLRPEVHYHAPIDVVAWTARGLQVRDAVAAPGRMLVQTVDPGTGAITSEARALTSAEIAAQLDTYALPCAVPPYGQTDPRWADDIMRICDLSIGEAGCALTSAAMVFGYYGDTRNPAQLNACLGDYACPIYWQTAANQCSSGLARYLDYPPFDWATIESTLAAGRPIIVRFARVSNPDWTHFVPIIGGAGTSPDGYTILDSWDGRTKSMAAYVGNGWTATGLARFTGEPACLSDDEIAPVGGITAPLTDTVAAGATLRLEGWASDEGGSGLASAQFLAHYGGAWRPVGPTYTAGAFSYSWDPCADGVPAGPLTLGLSLRDRAGNVSTSELPLVHLTWAGACAGVDHCQPPADGVTLYAEPGYAGECYLLPLGDHPTPWGWGLVGNDNVASVRVGAHAQVTLYEHDQFGGRAQTLTADHANLDGLAIGANQASSARVWPRTQPPAAPTLDYPAHQAAYDASAVLTLAWRGAAGATAYRAELWTDPATKRVLDWQPDSYWRVGALEPGATYSWQVQARGPGGESGWSATRQFSVAPLAPSDLRAIPGCGLVDLTWQGVAGADDYVIYRDGTAVGVAAGDAETFRDEATTAGATVSYTLRARSGNVESAPSPPVEVEALACPSHLPDLRPLADAEGLPVETEGPALYAGETASVSWWAANDGAASAGGFRASLLVDGAVVASWDVPAAPSGWRGGVADWPLLIEQPGWHTLSLVLDDTSAVSEVSEDNNAWSRQVYVVPTAPWSDGFEALDGAWQGAGLWRLDGADGPYPPNRTDQRGWWYGRPETGTYETGIYNAGHLTSLPVRIPAAGYALTFWYRVETESPGAQRDQRWVQISADGGPFTDLLQLEGEPTDTWLPSPPIDLSTYAGQDVRVRLRMDTIDESRNAHAGWAVDDVSIALAEPPACQDTHEPNGTLDLATPLTLGDRLEGSICPPGDTDWYQVELEAAGRVAVELEALAAVTAAEAPSTLEDDDKAAGLAATSLSVAVTLLDAAQAPLAEARGALDVGQALNLAADVPSPGSYSLRVRAAEHPATGGPDQAYALRVSQDTEPPEITGFSVGTGDMITSGTTQVTATVQDAGSGVANVRLWWHGPDWAASDWRLLAEGPPQGEAWSAALDPAALAEGRGGALYLQTFDRAGNWAGRGAWLLTVDRTPPTGTLVLQGGAAVTLSPRVAATVTGSSDIAAVQFRLGDGAWSPWEPYAGATQGGTHWVLLPDVSGDYTVAARLRDAAGNESPVYTASIRYQQPTDWLHLPLVLR